MTTGPAWGSEVLRIDPSRPLERRGITARPFPPDRCRDDQPECFVPSEDFAEWIRGTFIDASGPLAHEEHEHLADATIGVLWTNAINKSKMRYVVATAEMPNAMAGGWKRARFEFQLTEWFGVVPDFVLTFSAPDALRMSDREFCATVEHELLHCAQAEDGYGQPAFNRDTGQPKFAIRGHDVEEFSAVVRWYGPTSAAVREMVQAARMVPLVGDEPLDIACGVCAERAA